MKINFLNLYTPNLQAQLEFYRDVLQLPLTEEKESSFQLDIGYTRVMFKEDPAATPYHIAFHIPALQEQKALHWLKERVEVLKEGDAEIVDFPAWKARSIYFYDADSSIIEFISRKDLFETTSEEFSEAAIIGVSEIGLATGNVKEKYHFLQENCGITKFTGDFERFCATGDDQGLFIVINNKLKDWIPTGDEAYASRFETKISTTKGHFRIIFKNDRLELA